VAAGGWRDDRRSGVVPVAYREVVNFVVAVNNFGDTRSGGLAGPMGLFIILLMCIATVLLIRNMNKRLRRLPDSFQDAETERRAAEIARLNADLESPSAGADRAKVDGDRSAGPGAAAESEVNGADGADAPGTGRAKTDPA
jgi:hypothetical protein